MLKRTWIACSILWMLAVIGFRDQGQPLPGFFELCFPLLLGALIWISWRFVRGRRRELNPPNDSTEIVRHR